MKDVSLHLLDILENSAKAGATCVEVTLVRTGTHLTLAIADNGPGLPPSVRPDPTDPFRTTRTDRPAGMGLALLRATAERAGGTLQVANGEHGGVSLRAELDLAQLDAIPLGPLHESLAIAASAWPGLTLTVRLEPEAREVLNTVRWREVAADVPLSHPAVFRLLCEDLRRELGELLDWADEVRATAMANLGQSMRA